MKEELKRFLETSTLVDLQEVFEVLSKRVWQERLRNKGFVPPEIFNAVMGMGGVYTTVIAIPRVKDDEGNILGYAHKLREAGDDGFAGYYHQPGTLVRVTQSDPYGEALVRLTQEFFGNNTTYRGQKITETGFMIESIPLAFVWETFRKALATRIAFFVDIPFEVYKRDMVLESGKEWILIDDPQEITEKVISFELAWLRFAVSKERSEGALILPEEDVL